MAAEQHSLLIEDQVPVHANAPPPPTWTAGALKRAGICASFLVMLGLLVAVSRAPSAKHVRGSSSLRIISLAQQHQAVVQNFREAVGITNKAAGDLQAHINDVQETAEKARMQIDAWARAKAAQNDERINNYVEKQAKAAVLLSTIEEDFKAWCYTQSTLFKAQVMLLETKFNNSDGESVINIDDEYRFLKRTVAKSLEEIGDMMKKIISVRTDFNTLAANAKEMEREIMADADQLHQRVKAGEVTVAMASLTCVGGILGGAALGIGSLGSASLLSVGIAAGACGGVGIAGDVSIETLGSNWENAMRNQAAYAHKLGQKATDLESHVHADYRRMETCKKHLNTLDAALIPSVTIFKVVVIPEMKKLVDVLKVMADQQEITKKAE